MLACVIRPMSLVAGLHMCVGPLIAYTLHSLVCYSHAAQDNGKHASNYMGPARDYCSLSRLQEVFQQKKNA